MKTEDIGKASLATLVAISLILTLALSVSQISTKAEEEGPQIPQELAIWTDKDEYGPDETVTIFGSGFLPNAQVTITITAPDSSEDTIYEWTDNSGGFVAYYTLDGTTGTYRVTATDGINTARTTFYEPLDITVSYSAATYTITVEIKDMAANKEYYLEYYSPAGLEATHGPFISSVNNWDTTDTLTLLPTHRGGTWTIKLIEITTVKKTKTVDVTDTVWTTDSTYAVVKTSFMQGETVYVKGIGYDPEHGKGAEKGKWYVKFFYGATLKYTSPWITATSTWDITYSQALSPTDPTGTWTIKVYCAEHDALHGSTTFTVTPYVPPTATVTFGQVDVGNDFTGVVLTVDGTDYYVDNLPKSFTWTIDSAHTFEYHSPLDVDAGKQYVWTNTAGLSADRSGTIIVPIGGGTVTGYYKTQYRVTFAQTGLDADATGTVVTVDNTSKGYGDLPYGIWVDNGGNVAYAYQSTVSSSVENKQFVLVGVTGPTSPITVTGPTTVTGNYKTQYRVTFAQTGLDADATGTVVTVDNTSKGYGDLPYGIWVDNGGNVAYAYQSTVSSSVENKQFVLVGVTGPTSPITVTGPTTVTGYYKTQYRVTFAQTGLDADATGTVVTVDNTSKGYGDLPYGIWVDNGGNVAYAYQSTVSSSVENKQFVLVGVTGPTSPITVTGPTTVTGNYKTQYRVTFAQTGLDADATGTVVTVDNTSKGYGDLPYGIWVDNGGNVAYAYQSTVSSSVENKQFVLVGVTGPTSPITVTGPTTVTGNYKTQYRVTFAQTGLDADATGTVVTVDNTSKGYGDLPYGIWVDNGGNVAYAYQSTVSSSVENKQFVLVGVTGPTSPITVTGPTTVTGNYKTQYRVTFAQTGLDADATGTVVTVDNTSKGYGDLPYGIWVDNGGNVAYAYQSTVSSSVENKQFVLVGVTGPTSPITVTGPTTVTGNYKTQYRVTFAQTGLDADATGTVVTVDNTSKGYGDLPYGIWVDNGGNVAYAYQSTVSSSVENKQFVLVGVTGPTSPITVTGPTTVTGNYKTQYYLTVRTNPPGIVEILGEGWYDECTKVGLTAPLEAGVNYLFERWVVDGEESFGAIIEVHMDKPKTATAFYRDYLGHAKEEIKGLANYLNALRADKKIDKREYEHFMRDLDRVEKDIDKAIKNFDKERAGYDDKMKGFDDLRRAVMKIRHMIRDVDDWARRGRIPAGDAAWIIGELETLRMKLVNKARGEALAERALALKAIADAKAQGRDTTRAEEEIVKVDRELAKAAQNISEGKLAQAIQHLKHAFAHSHHAIKKAYDPTWDIDYKDWIDELEEMGP